MATRAPSLLLLVCRRQSTAGHGLSSRNGLAAPSRQAMRRAGSSPGSSAAHPSTCRVMQPMPSQWYRVQGASCRATARRPPWRTSEYAATELWTNWSCKAGMGKQGGAAAILPEAEQWPNVHSTVTSCEHKLVLSFHNPGSMTPAQASKLQASVACQQRSTTQHNAARRTTPMMSSVTAAMYSPNARHAQTMYRVRAVEV